MITHLSVENMTCGGCARSVTKAVHGVDPQARVVVEVARKLVSVDSSACEPALVQAITAAGFPAKPAART